MYVKGLSYSCSKQPTQLPWDPRTRIPSKFDIPRKTEAAHDLQEQGAHSACVRACVPARACVCVCARVLPTLPNAPSPSMRCILSSLNATVHVLTLI